MSGPIKTADVARWDRLAELIRTAPLLRLYCAMLPGGTVGPVPAHPGPAVGTVVLGVTALTDDDAGRSALRELVDGRDSREEALEHFLDRLVSPLARVFRACLEHGFRPPGPSGLAYESSPGRGATGRVVVTDAAEPPDARDVLSAIRSTLRRLGVLFATAGIDGVTEPVDVVCAAVDARLGAELRFLRPEAHAALSGAENDLLHTVDPQQHDVLTEILREVADHARRRRLDPRVRRPAVVLDVDLCALDPRRRTVHALQVVAAPRPGAPDGISEFTTPDRLPVLPTYHRPAWDLFLAGTGLHGRYPGVDWDQVLAEYRRAFYRPWDQLRWDTPAPGLSRFVWDVHDAGGYVVFNTARRHRVRAPTEYALAQAGIVRPRLLMLPDDRVRPVHELKSENLRALADLEVLAIFDDLCENRQAMAKELPSARMVAVELAGFVSERPPGGRPDDGAPVIRTFETVPRGRLVAGPALSHTRSPAELRIGEMSAHPVADDHAVRLTTPESLQIVDALTTAADRAAEQTAESALRRGAGSTVALVHHLLTRNQFLKGPRRHFTKETVRPFVERGAPLQVVTCGFPVKLHYNGLKTAGILPDLAELAALVRFRELQRTITHVYPPGLRITILTDGNHYRSRPAEVLRDYRGKLEEYRRLVGGSDVLEITDLNDVATDHLGPVRSQRRIRRIEEYVGLVETALAGIDVTEAPLEALAEASRICRGLIGDRPDGTPILAFSALFHSLVYSVELPPPPARTTRAGWARRLYAGIFDVVDPAAGPQITAGRRAVLTTTWRDTVRYLAVMQVDGEFGCDDMAFFPGRVRLTPNPRPGSLGFSYLGGSCVLPWHGVGVVDAGGIVSVDYAVSLSDQGFVPVFSPLLSSTQPWFMTPVTSTRLVDRCRGNELDAAFRTAVRLRRR
ncbi:L-tyrosine/L-tryptophan isonitrile synthase family protein [Actinoallomurus vinaceus]